MSYQAIRGRSFAADENQMPTLQWDANRANDAYELANKIEAAIAAHTIE